MSEWSAERVKQYLTTCRITEWRITQQIRRGDHRLAPRLPELRAHIARIAALLPATDTNAPTPDD